MQRILKILNIDIKCNFFFIIILVGEVELDFWGDFKCAHWGGVLCSVEGDRLPSPCVPGQAVRPQGGVVDL